MQSGELLCDLMKLQNILNFELLKKLGSLGGPNLMGKGFEKNPA